MTWSASARTSGSWSPPRMAGSWKLPKRTKLGDTRHTTAPGSIRALPLRACLNFGKAGVSRFLVDS